MPPHPRTPTDQPVVDPTPIGYVDSPLASRDDAPKQPDEGAPPARLVLDATTAVGLEGLAPGDEVVVVTWLHEAARDVLRVHPRGDRDTPARGVFTTRSPDRPNPIGLHRVTITAVHGGEVEVDALEAIDGTPVLDLKPARGC